MVLPPLCAIAVFWDLTPPTAQRPPPERAMDRDGKRKVIMISFKRISCCWRGFHRPLPTDTERFNASLMFPIDGGSCDFRCRDCGFDSTGRTRRGWWYSRAGRPPGDDRSFLQRSVELFLLLTDPEAFR